MRWLALMDEYGRELSYSGYSRQRVPDLVPGTDWILVAFAKYPGPERVLVAGGWLCDSETSRMRDGDWLPLAKVINPGEFVHIHIRGERDDDVELGPI